MGLILQSLLLSFGVFGRMVLPALALLFLSALVWTPLNAVTGGYVHSISGPITATFISLFGIRAALSLMGDHHRTSFQMLALYAVLYGVALLVAKGSVLVLAQIAALAYADWSLGGAVTIHTFMNAEKSLQSAFAFNAISAKAILSLMLYTSVYVLMAVPLASAARSAGQGAKNARFFNGFGRSFVPLFIVFALSFFAQFFFGLFTFLFAIIPLFLSVVSIVLTQTLPGFDLDILLKGLAAGAGLLWLHSWIWAASAVALARLDKGAERPQPAAPPMHDAIEEVRSLRKSREKQFS